MRPQSSSTRPGASRASRAPEAGQGKHAGPAVAGPGRSVRDAAAVDRGTAVEGAAALAGTSYPLDRHYTAQLLGFDRPAENSLDAVSDRDFAIEFCALASLALIHFSRWCEELVLWTSAQFNFIELPDRFCTGSSIMPQKKNPDVPELIRGKSGRVFGHLVALLTLMKSQPLAYNKDNQEDKEPLFDSVEHVSLALAALSGMIATATANECLAGEAENAWAVITRPTKTSMGATAASGISLYKKSTNPKIAPRNKTMPTPNAYPQRPFKRL